MLPDLLRYMFACIYESDGADIDGDKFSNSEIYEVQGEVRKVTREFGMRYSVVEEPLESTG